MCYIMKLADTWLNGSEKAGKLGNNSLYRRGKKKGKEEKGEKEEKERKNEVK